MKYYSMTGKVIIIVAGVLALVLFPCSGVMADEMRLTSFAVPEPAALLGDVIGDVSLIRNGYTYPVPKAGLGLKEGDIVVVGDQSGVEDQVLVFLAKDRNSTILLKKNSSLIIVGSSNAGVEEVYLEGKEVGQLSNAFFEINHLKPGVIDEFRIYTPDGIIGVRGTAFDLYVRNWKDTSLKSKIVPHHTGYCAVSSAGCVWEADDVYFAVLDCEASAADMLGPVAGAGTAYDCSTLNSELGDIEKVYNFIKNGHYKVTTSVTVIGNPSYLEDLAEGLYIQEAVKVEFEREDAFMNAVVDADWPTPYETAQVNENVSNNTQKKDEYKEKKAKQAKKHQNAAQKQAVAIEANYMDIAVEVI